MQEDKIGNSRMVQNGKKTRLATQPHSRVPRWAGGFEIWKFDVCRSGYMEFRNVMFWSLQSWVCESLTQIEIWKFENLRLERMDFWSLETWISEIRNAGA